jgi:hypothetical protein
LEDDDLSTTSSSGVGGGAVSSSFGEGGEGETDMLTKHMEDDPEKEHIGEDEDYEQDTFMDDQGKIV